MFEIFKSVDEIFSVEFGNFKYFEMTILTIMSNLQI